MMTGGETMAMRLPEKKAAMDVLFQGTSHENGWWLGVPHGHGNPWAISGTVDYCYTHMILKVLAVSRGVPILLISAESAKEKLALEKHFVFIKTIQLGVNMTSFKMTNIFP